MNTCIHGKTQREECDLCHGGFDNASPIINETDWIKRMAKLEDNADCSVGGLPEKTNWFCPKCGKALVEVKLNAGAFPSCLFCGIKYTIHGTGVDESLFVLGAETLKIEF